ncbi:hypothetical protein B1A87_004160 [Arthrobacter sp. KBS0703]|uniref:hypothetical protein n=1 Tax=Arthrobacter sp. KBS0703 TaxID=1955698 RepID=UPI00098ED56D|nr:hypothetical protein [Arthrobacter sp. KBS0703]TSE15236.1 hypothetical protein B1A87_004160 [Arthrobacter sp. KBS0703]
MTRAAARKAEAPADTGAPEAVEPAPADVTVKVAAPYQVSHDGKVYGTGETLTVPADVAEPWLLAGWVNTVNKAK